MREDRKRRGTAHIGNKNNSSIKNALYIGGSIVLLGLIAFFITIMIYNNNLEKLYSDLDTEKLGMVTDNTNSLETVNEIEDKETSANLGKTIEELEDSNQTNIGNTTATQTVQETNQNETKKEEVVKEEKKDNNDKQENKTNQTKPTSSEVKEEVKDPEFKSPVDGEIMKDYAKDNLVYSETLKEWVTHTALDIKADKTTVVKAAADGTVTAIKNDPRYGTTIIIEHTNGFETRYANLLTAEFVNVGEKVTCGQTIGTVGNTASFEILDDYHLHFEILKNGEFLDPKIYIGI